LSSARAAQFPFLAPRCAAIVGTLLATLAIAPAAASATALPTTISENMTLNAAGSPYTGTSTTISEGVTVTAQPGVLVKLTGTLAVKGTLDVNGAAEEPVVFTSSSDSAPGEWTGIMLQAGAGESSLTNAEVRYSKTGISISGGISPEVVDSFLHHSTSTGISVSGGGAAEIANNEISDNGHRAIYYTAGSSAQGQINIHDNLIERNMGTAGSEGAIRVSLGSSTQIKPVSLGDNDVNDNAGQAIYYEGATIPVDIDENSLSGNGKNGVWVSGTVAESVTWEDRGYAFVSHWNGITVAAGATLTLAPGSTIKGEIRGITVNGALIADGTETEPITFTSINDDSVDGDTDGDGSATSPAPGDWPGVVYPSVKNAELSYLALHYAERAIDIDYLDSITISNSDFIHNEAAIEVAQTAENDPALGALSCLPPYLSFVISSNNWFGETGYPSPSLDISSAVGAVIPEEYAPLFGAASSLASFSAPLYPGGDTIPFSIYSCPALGIPPIPVTPVIVTAVPLEPWFSLP
jgi:hypothetical protein